MLLMLRQTDAYVNPHAAAYLLVLGGQGGIADVEGTSRVLIAVELAQQVVVECLALPDADTSKCAELQLTCWFLAARAASLMLSEIAESSSLLNWHRRWL